MPPHDNSRARTLVSRSLLCLRLCNRGGGRSHWYCFMSTAGIAALWGGLHVEKESACGRCQLLKEQGDMFAFKTKNDMGPKTAGLAPLFESNMSWWNTTQCISSRAIIEWDDKQTRVYSGQNKTTHEDKSRAWVKSISVIKNLFVAIDFRDACDLLV